MLWSSGHHAMAMAITSKFQVASQDRVRFQWHPNHQRESNEQGNMLCRNMFLGMTLNNAQTTGIVKTSGFTRGYL